MNRVSQAIRAFTIFAVFHFIYPSLRASLPISISATVSLSSPLMSCSFHKTKVKRCQELSALSPSLESIFLRKPSYIITRDILHVVSDASVIRDVLDDELLELLIVYDIYGGEHHGTKVLHVKLSVARHSSDKLWKNWHHIS